MAKRKNLRKAVERASGVKIPKALEVDHKVPLAEGGSNAAENLQLLPKAAHKVKTSIENKVRRAKRGRMAR